MRAEVQICDTEYMSKKTLEGANWYYSKHPCIELTVLGLAYHYMAKILAFHIYAE